MVHSSLHVATRALASVLLVLARSYLVVLEVNRDSPPEQVLKAYRKVLLKVHPDKGGKKADAQKLQEAKEAWDKARKGSAGKADSTTGALAVKKAKRKEYRVNAQVVLLTYQGVAGLEQWHRFVAWARGSLKKFGVQRWGATLEACETDGLHTHLFSRRSGPKLCRFGHGVAVLRATHTHIEEASPRRRTKRNNK
jgi:hypothetical protein